MHRFRADAKAQLPLLSISQAVTFWYDECVENSLYRRVPRVLGEDNNGQIFAQPYNITSPPNDM